MRRGDPMTADLLKMTITVPEWLQRRAKAVAALRGESVSEVVRGALEEYVSAALIEDADVRAVLQIETDIEAGNELMHTWDKVKAELREGKKVRTAGKSKSELPEEELVPA